MLNVVILHGDWKVREELWVNACAQSPHVDSVETIDIMGSDWLSRVSKKRPDLYLLRPPGRYDYLCRIYEERISLIDKEFGVPMYPSLESLKLLENKRYLSDWLSVNSVPHPETFVFSNRQQGESFVREYSSYPLVGKMNMGAAASGVVVLYGVAEAVNYVRRAFGEGLRRRARKKRVIRSLAKAFLTKTLPALHDGFVKTDLRPPEAAQVGFIIFQEHIQHDYEWRCVRIGESFFAHKKIVKEQFASGTKIKGYDAVPESLLNFVKDVSDRTKVQSAAFDIFEVPGGYLINEIQCLFGQSDKFQMLLDGEPGRFTHGAAGWRFEKGNFSENGCYDLRLQHAIAMLGKSRVPV